MLRHLLLISAVMLGVAVAAAQEPTPTDSEPDEQSTKSDGGAALPVPRFVSLRTNPVNLRIGPGVRYPVEWVYVRRNLPVEIVAQFETWRRIRDQDGAEGWVHQSMLSGRRTAVVVAAGKAAVALRKSATEPSDTVAALEPGVVVAVQRCPADATACRVEVAGHQGWLPRTALWGLYPTETID